MNVAWVMAAIAGAALGLALLRAAWARRGGGWRTAAGWLALAAGAGAWRAAGPAWDKALAYALLAPSLLALVVLASGAELRRGGGRRKDGSRTARERAGAVEPAPASRRTDVVRFLLAGPAAFAAALGLAALTALRAPWGEADRLVAAGFLLPLAWAAGCVWATTDARPSRVAAGLAATAAAAFAGALL